MRALCVVAIACIALVATEGCRRPKREPVPGPTAGIRGISAATLGITSHKRSGSNSQHDSDTSQGMDSGSTSMQHGAVGITWFQGTVEEAFSRAGTRRSGAAGQHGASQCPGTMPPPRLRRGAADDDA